MTNDYTTVLPIQKNIDFLRYLKKFGNTIIIQTARRMKTCGSNIGKVNKDIGKITFDTLEKFDIPYDEIYFGKPYADYYIDDLAINAFDSLEKEMGFYKNSIDPRDFNSVTKTSLEIIKKESNNGLDGEIHYYLNIPLEIKDMFPILFDYDTQNFKWYNIEYINGIPVSKLFLSQELNLTQFQNILNSIDRIHNCKFENIKMDDVNIYDNYSNKLKKRYNEYDYSIFPKSFELYEELMKQLTEYETNNKGKIGVIHGDTVFTNIIINKYEKIKFIDMRGKIGTKLSLIGDQLYDWAKFYQSLIGYDEILDGKHLNSNYTNKFIEIFEKKIIDIYGDEYLSYIKLITKSLLFTLIPLHDNSNCVQFYELIKKI
jgi:capsule biosynthesis phosphatase